MRKNDREGLFALVIWLTIIFTVFFGIHRYFGWKGIMIFILSIAIIVISIIAIWRFIRRKRDAAVAKYMARFNAEIDWKSQRDADNQRQEFSRMSVKEMRRKIVKQVVSFEQQHGSLYGMVNEKALLREQVIDRLNEQFAWEKGQGLVRTGSLLDGMNDDVVIYDYSAADWEEADSSDR